MKIYFTTEDGKPLTETEEFGGGQVVVDFPKNLVFDLMQQAHTHNITFQDYFNNVLKNSLKKLAEERGVKLNEK